MYSMKKFVTYIWIQRMSIHSPIHQTHLEHFYILTVPGTVPSTGETAVNKNIPLLHNLQSRRVERESINKQIKNIVLERGKCCE